jgi:hypothetical protein
MTSPHPHTSPKTATTPVANSITRVTLSNGYRAYRRRDSRDNQTGRQQKRVRFVKGHVTIPDSQIVMMMQSALSPGSEAEAEDSMGCGDEDGNGDGSGDGPDGDEHEAGVGEEREEGDVEGMAGLAGEMKERGKSGGKREQPTEEHERKKGKGGFVIVHRGGVAVWRKQPRFRGSGTLRVLDDPVRDGLRLARSRAGLPSDRWRDRSDVVVRVNKGRAGAGEDKGLRDEYGEREADFGMEALVRQEFGYTVRVVRSRQTKREEAKGEERNVEGPEVRGEGAVPETVALMEVGSDSERDDLDEYDLLVDVSLDEADGWVPVMVAEEDEGDDWMSLTGSWVMMGSMAEGTK